MAVLVLYGVQIARADINGSVSGIVTDPSGAVIRGVQVRAVNTSTGVEHAIRTDSAGFLLLSRTHCRQVRHRGSAGRF